MYKKIMISIIAMFLLAVSVNACKSVSNTEMSELAEIPETTETIETTEMTESRWILVTEEEFQLFLEEFEGNYIEEDYKGIYTCYYKTINGYKTNEYYKVFNGRIEKKSVSITKEEIEEAEKLVLRETQYKIPEENEFGKLAEIQDEYILYMKFKGEIIPVKMVEAIYGYSKLEMICINLLDDTILDYEELWGYN